MRAFVLYGFTGLFLTISGCGPMPSSTVPAPPTFRVQQGYTVGSPEAPPAPNSGCRNGAYPGIDGLCHPNSERPSQSP